jgi:hypothetical protein
MSTQHITPAKRKRLLKTFGPFPAGFTHDDLERFLDLLYGMFSDVYTMAELRQIVVSDPFDRSEHPRQLKLVELTDWLEVLVAKPLSSEWLSFAHSDESDPLLFLRDVQRAANL